MGEKKKEIDHISSQYKIVTMTFTEIQSEVEALSTEDQERLAAFLALRQNERDQEWCEKISKRLNDRTKENWISLDKLESDS